MKVLILNNEAITNSQGSQLILVNHHQFFDVIVLSKKQNPQIIFQHMDHDHQHDLNSIDLLYQDEFWQILSLLPASNAFLTHNSVKSNHPFFISLVLYFSNVTRLLRV